MKKLFSDLLESAHPISSQYKRTFYKRKLGIVALKKASGVICKQSHNNALILTEILPLGIKNLIILVYLQIGVLGSRKLQFTCLYFGLALRKQFRAIFKF